MDLVRRLLSRGARVNAKDADGRRSLHYAAEAGQKEIAELLIASGADVNAKIPVPWGPDRGPAGKQRVWGEDFHPETSRRRGGWVVFGVPIGFTPLHYAALHGHKEVAEVLMANGADVNARDSSGQTPLHFAVAGGRKEIAGLLVSKGADVNARNNSGETPLHLAVHNGRNEIAELLIAKGAELEAKDKNGNTPLQRAVHWKRDAIGEILRKAGAKE